MTLTKWQYCAISEEYYHSDLGVYSTYAIQIIAPGYLELLHDVSTCKKTVENMVELFNLHQLSPTHLYDAVTDMLP